MSRYIFFVIIFMPALSHAQIRGKVEVIKDPRIDTLIARRLNITDNRTIHTARTTTHNVSPVYVASGPGFRVQIFSGSERKDAYDAQARFKSKHPAMRTYIIYNEPNFKVRAGDFRTHLEAEKLMQELRGSFSSLFIIEEKVNFPKAGTPND